MEANSDASIPDTRASQREALIAVLAFVVVMGGLGALIAATLGAQPGNNARITTGFGLLITAIGLIGLVRLAAFGPTPHEHRMQQTLQNCNQLLFGVSLLLPSGGIKYTFLSLSLACVFAGLLKRPRRFFAATASGVR